MNYPARSKLLSQCAVFVALALPIAAQVTVVKPESAGFSGERLERINQAMQRAIDTQVVAGGITVVSRGNQVVHFKTHGLMDVESKKPMARDALFRMASMTKPVISVAILMLMEEGKVRLHDPVSHYIPEFKNPKVAVRSGSAAAGGSDGKIAFTTEPAKREITVRDLLTHVSGVTSGPISTQELAKALRKPEENLAAYVSRLVAIPLEFQPGSRWSYSPGGGFDMLGRVIEVASGMTLDQFFQRRIFTPLGMVDTFFGPPPAPGSRAAPIYKQSEQKGGTLTKVPVTDPRFLPGNVYFSGAGGLTSTAADYVRFGQMLANRGEWKGKRLLAPATVDLMSAAHVPDTLPGRTPGIGYGLGVQVVTDRGAAGRMQSSGGYGWGGAHGTHFWVDPKLKIVGLLMIQVQGNQTDIRSDFETTVMQAMVQE